MTKKENLETIAKKISSKNLWTKGWAYIKAIEIGGVLPEKYQQEFVKILNLYTKKEWNSKKLTIYNASFGLVISSIEITSGKGGSYLISKISETANLPGEDLIYAYALLQITQNVSRIIYAQVNNKGFASFSLFGAGTYVIHFASRKIKSLKDKL